MAKESNIELTATRAAKLVVAVGVIWATLYAGLALKFVTTQAFAEHLEKEKNDRELLTWMCYRMGGEQKDCNK